MAVKRIPTLEQLSDTVAGIGRALHRLSVQTREAREAGLAANAGLESLAKKFAVVYEALVATGAVAASPVEPPTEPGASLGIRPSSALPAHSVESGERAHQSHPKPEAGPSWLTVASWEQAQAIMEVLVPWLAAVYLRYPDATLPTCWAWHPEAVEELWWLCRAWHDAYACEEPSSQRAGDWHDRQRPAVAKRLTSSLRMCRLAKHVDRTEHAHPAVPGADTVAHITTAWASPDRAGWPLVPTEPQLADEQTKLDAQTPRRRAS
jgi:hypothetical protein